MPKIEQFSRLVNHRISSSGTQFTVPTSDDHTDETWVSTDLYIGEIGINVTDDTAFMRTNNGIIQIATGTSSGASGTATPAVFVFNTPNIEIGSTYSADAVTPRSGYYTDLGDATLRWKDLYLGGSTNGNGTINANAGLLLREATDYIITTNAVDSNNSPIEIGDSSSNISKDRNMWLNTRGAYATGSNTYITTVSAYGVTVSNNNYCVAVGGTDYEFDNGVDNVVHLGSSKNRSNSTSNEVIVGDQLSVRGVEDDGTTQYNKSEWITSQELLRTSTGNTTTIVNLPWTATASGGDVIQVKAYIIGTDIQDATTVYSAEIMGAYSISGTASSLTVTEIGVPVLNAQSSWTGTQPDCEMAADGNGVYVQVTGIASNTIQWLCSYSYHRLINVY